VTPNPGLETAGGFGAIEKRMREPVTERSRGPDFRWVEGRLPPAGDYSEQSRLAASTMSSTPMLTACSSAGANAIAGTSGIASRRTGASRS
jgi:hypothetical protein